MDEEKDGNTQLNQKEPRIIVKGKILSSEDAQRVKIVAPGMPEYKPPPVSVYLSWHKFELLAMAEYYRSMAHKYKDAFNIAIQKVWEKDETIELLQNIKGSVDSWQQIKSEQEKADKSNEKADRALREMEKVKMLSPEIFKTCLRWVNRPRIPHISMQDFLEDLQTAGDPFISVDNLKKALPILYKHGLIDKVNGRFVPIYEYKNSH